jgi:hypothetical protein
MCVCKLEAANPVFAFVARQNGRKSCREKIPLAMQGFKWQREVKRFFHRLPWEGKEEMAAERPHPDLAFFRN